MTTRVCNSCGVEKGFSEYHKKHDCKDGIRPKCKACCNKDQANRRKSRAGCPKSKKYWEEWYSKNKDNLLKRQRVDESRKEYAQRRYKQKKSEINKQQSEYRKTPRHKFLNRKKEAKRRASKVEATPDWLTEDQERQIEDFYWLAKDLQSVTGEVYHVDHIAPLKGKNICGLHVPWNLQVLPADINLSKSNKF